MLRKIDDAIYAAERWLTLALISVMALAVFVDVTHRKFSEPVGQVESLLARFLPVSPEVLDAWIAPAALLLLTFALVYFAVRSMEVEPRIAPGRALAAAAGIAVGLAVSVKLLLVLLPNGLIFSQKMALCFMLWVGFLGASMATREGNHIVFEVADRIWPRKWQPAVKWITRVIAAAFCIALAVLAVSYTSHHYRDWTESDGVAGVFEGFAVPIWTIYGFLPIPLLIMAFRFLFLGVFTSELAVDSDTAVETVPPSHPASPNPDPRQEGPK